MTNDDPSKLLRDRIVAACRRLEQPESQPSLEDLAQGAGLSPWHFQRLFKRIVGVTPKQYAKRHQSSRFAEHLRNGATVTDAVFDSGFSSTSRAHDQAGGRLAMKPSDLRRGGQGLTIRYGIAQSSLGWVIVGMTDKGLCAIEFGDGPAILPELLTVSFPNATLADAGPDFAKVLNQVVAFLDDPGAGLDLPLDIRGTAFQERVWQVLRTIPAGQTVSYADVAKRLGNPRSVRAVAGACAANKLAVAIPCHRVVRSDGDLSGYRWGVERKRTLLERESRD